LGCAGTAATEGFRIRVCTPNFSNDEQLTSVAEFKVQKSSNASDNPTRRILCLSETCLVERDPLSYTAVCARPLKTVSYSSNKGYELSVLNGLLQIVCLIRDLMGPQAFQVEYESGEKRAYSSNERDPILASLLDGARGSGNYQIFVTSSKTTRSLRILPYSQLLDEESEQQLMKHITNVPRKM
jgi:DnaJ homolog subfamily C member 13